MADRGPGSRVHIHGGKAYGRGPGKGSVVHWSQSRRWGHRRVSDRSAARAVTRGTQIECSEISLEQARRIPPIFSSYETDIVHRLAVEHCEAGIVWTLYEEKLERQYRKRYDSGRLEDWLEPYFELAPRESLHFIAAQNGDDVVGLLTWQKVEWNDTLWLIDIRTRKESRRRGVGGVMLERLKREARDLRVRGISVETQINNCPAIRFYRRHGFGISGFNDHLYTNRDVEKQDVALFLFWESR